MHEDTNISRAPKHARFEGPDRRQLSPELVLVDPELAAWAREQLVATAEAEPSPVGAAKARTPVVRLEPERELVHTAARTWTPTLGPSTTVGRRPPGPESAARATRRGLARGRRVARRSRTALAVAAVLLAAIALMPRAASDRPVLVGADASTTPEPQTFVWPEAEAAHGYELVLTRGAQTILVARTLEPRLMVSGQWTYRGRSFTLSPGSYRWSVWPLGPGSGRVGNPIVEAKLVVEAA